MLKSKLLVSVNLLTASFLIFAVFSNPVSAATRCDFSRDLELGAEGEDVRCLQKFLNESGYTIAKDGVGSPGRETNQFKDLTKKALQAWQSSQGINPTGAFASVSKEKYSKIKNPTMPSASPSISPTVSPTPSPSSSSNQTQATSLSNASLVQQISDLKAQVKELQSSKTTSTVTGSEKTARDAIKKALGEIKDADDQIRSGGGDTTKAKKEFENARNDMDDAINAFFAGNYDQVLAFAKKSFDNAEDAFLAADGKSQEDEIDTYINEVDDKIDEAADKIDTADSEGKSVTKAETILDQARSKIDDAKAKYDAKKYDDAESLAKEAETLVKDSVRAIGSDSDEKTTAKDLIKSTKTAFNKAQDKVNQAEDDGVDVDKAQSYLKSAETKLKNAQDQYNNRDYAEAITQAQSARKYIDKAKNAI